MFWKGHKRSFNIKIYLRVGGKALVVVYLVSFRQIMSSFDDENSLFYMYLLLRIPHFNQTCLFGFKENSSATPCPSMNILEQSRMQRIFFTILSRKKLPSFILVIILSIWDLFLNMFISCHGNLFPLKKYYYWKSCIKIFQSCIFLSKLHFQMRLQLRLHLTLTTALISNQN